MIPPDEREVRVGYQAEGMDITRFEDRTVLIDPPQEGQIHISSLQAYLVATFIFGTDPDRDPYCCAGDG